MCHLSDWCQRGFLNFRTNQAMGCSRLTLSTTILKFERKYGRRHLSLVHVKKIQCRFLPVHCVAIEDCDRGPSMIYPSSFSPKTEIRLRDLRCTLPINQDVESSGRALGPFFFINRYPIIFCYSKLERGTPPGKGNEPARSKQ